MPYSAVIIAAVLAYTWILDPAGIRWARRLIIAGAVVLVVMRAARTGEWGLRDDALAPGLRLAAFLTFPAVLVLYGIGLLLGTTQSRPDPLGDLLFLVIWGGAQQFALQTVLLRESQQVLSRRAGLWLAAAIFAALHLPNPFLTAVTFIAGLGWCWVYDRHPNLLPLALSHAVGTLAILHAFDEGVTGRLRVGYAYLMLTRAATDGGMD